MALRGVCPHAACLTALLGVSSRLPAAQALCAEGAAAQQWTTLCLFSNALFLNAAPVDSATQEILLTSSCMAMLARAAGCRDRQVVHLRFILLEQKPKHV